MRDTITVQRANVILDVSPDEKDYYLGQGFAVVNDKGEVVEETTIVSAEALTRRIEQLERVIAEKDAEIAKLKASKPGRKAAEKE